MVGCSTGRREVTTAVPGRWAMSPRPSTRPSSWPESSCTSRSPGGTWSGTAGRTQTSRGESAGNRPRPPSMLRLAMASMLLQFGLTEIAAPTPAPFAEVGRSSSNVSMTWTRWCARSARARCRSSRSSLTTMSWARSCGTLRRPRRSPLVVHRTQQLSPPFPEFHVSSSRPCGMCSWRWLEGVVLSRAGPVDDRQRLRNPQRAVRTCPGVRSAL